MFVKLQNIFHGFQNFPGFKITFLKFGKTLKHSSTLKNVQELLQTTCSFFNFIEIIYDLQALQESLKNIWKLGKHCRTSTTKDPQALQESLKNILMLCKYVELPQPQKNYLGPPGTPGVFEKYSEAWETLWNFYNFKKNH